MINYYTYSFRINHKSKSSNTDEKNYETDNKNENSDEIINNIMKKIANFNDNNAIMNVK